MSYPGPQKDREYLSKITTAVRMGTVRAENSPRDLQVSKYRRCGTQSLNYHVRFSFKEISYTVFPTVGSSI